MPTKTLNGTTFHYQERGHGRAVVLVHGFPLDSSMWESQIEDLSDRYRVIAPDLRGFGQTQSSDPFTMASLADDLHGLLKSINALPCVLAGLSMGGYVALSFARQYCSDLHGLTLIDTRSEADTPQARENRDSMIAAVRKEGAKPVVDSMLPKLLWEQNAKNRLDIVHKLRRMMESQPPRTIENALTAMRDRDDSGPVLPEIRVPTLVVVGEHDAITPPAVAQAMCKQLRNPTLVTIPRSGHMTPMEQPDEVTTAMRRFLEQATMAR